jgi:DMSO reductase anchor subunit
MASMSKHTGARVWRDLSALLVVMSVFGLAVLMIFERYEPAVITAVVTATSLAAAELVRRVRETPRRRVESDHSEDATQ